MRTTGAALLGAGAITVVGGLTTQLLDSSVSDNVYSSPYSSSAFVVVCVIRGVLTPWRVVRYSSVSGSNWVSRARSSRWPSLPRMVPICFSMRPMVSAPSH